MKAFQDQHGSSIPLKELPAQSYFEVLGRWSKIVFSTLSNLPRWSLSTLWVGVGLRTQKHTHNISRCCSTGPLFVQRSV